MSTATGDITQRERELGAIIDAYNAVTEKLKQSHEQLGLEVRRLHEELARKNRQLRRREKLAALGEMAAGVAHEIRNPLGGIRVFASLLERDLKDRPESLRLVEKISKGVLSLEAIVADILEFSRPSDPQAVPIRLDQLVQETLELAGARIAETGVIVQAGELLAEVELVSDAALLQRAMLNLVLNAVDAAGSPGDALQGGRVFVTARAGAGDRVCITVSDNGPGIPSHLLDRIFNPFFTTKNDGTGLGLAIVHQIVETLGGTVQAANGGGGGAVFTLSVPRVLEVERTTGEV